MPTNALTVKVNDKSKVLRFGETLVAGSVYAVTVEGGAATCGESAVLGLKVGDATVGWAVLVNGAGELSLLTQELADALASVREGTRVAALAAIRCTDDGGDQVVAVGKADILYAGKEWFATSDLVRVTAKGDKGDDGASAYEVAVRNGYRGTESEWTADLLYSHTAAKAAQVAAEDARTDARAAQTAAERAAADAAEVARLFAALHLNYAVVSRTASDGGTVSLADRTITVVAVTGDAGTSATVNVAFPEAISNQVRDFWLVLVTPLADTVLRLPATVYAEDADVFALAVGQGARNVIAFTEEPGRIIASRRVFAHGAAVFATPDGADRLAEEEAAGEP